MFVRTPNLRRASFIFFQSAITERIVVGAALELGQNFLSPVFCFAVFIFFSGEVQLTKA